MHQSKKARQQKPKTVPNVSQRPGGTTTTPARRGTVTTPARIVNPLPSQYHFTPPAAAPLSQSPQVPVFGQQSTSAPHIGNYPPPQQLFQTNPPPQREEVPTTSSHDVQNQTSHQSSQQQDDEASPIQNSNLQSHPSSQGNNFEDPAPVVPDLEEDTLRALNALLLVPDRERFTTVLSPIPTPNSTWYVNRLEFSF